MGQLTLSYVWKQKQIPVVAAQDREKRAASGAIALCE
jgi:hypothetical protein